MDEEGWRGAVLGSLSLEFHGVCSVLGMADSLGDGRCVLKVTQLPQQHIFFLEDPRQLGYLWAILVQYFLFTGDNLRQTKGFWNLSLPLHPSHFTRFSSQPAMQEDFGLPVPAFYFLSPITGSGLGWGRTEGHTGVLVDEGN